MKLLHLTVPALALGQRFQNFSQTCDSIALAGFSLKASCSALAAQDSPRAGKLDLNRCVGLDQETARLTFAPYGKLANYCHGCTIASPAVLSCECKPISGGASGSTTLNLDDGVGNENGVLICAGTA